MTDKQLICLGEIVGVHGIRGDVKIKLFGDNPKILTKQAMLDAKGQPLCTITSIKDHGGISIATIEGIADRTQAEKWRGKKLHIERTALPEIKKKNTYYHADLIGLEARHIDGSVMGRVIAVANFGAGDLLDIKPARGNSFYIPFTDDAVPDVDIEGGFVSIDPPVGLFD